MSEQEKFVLSPDAFSINAKGEVVIDNSQLKQAVLDTAMAEATSAEHIRVAVSVG